MSVAIADDLADPQWRFVDLTDFSVGPWEPSYDTELWAGSKVLHIFTLHVGQGDGQTTEDLRPQQVSILGYRPK